MLDIAAFITRNAIESHSLRFANQKADFCAEMVFPPLVVDKSFKKLWQYDNTHLKEAETHSGTMSKAAEVDYGGFYTNVTTDLHKLAGKIDPRDEANADSVNNNIREDTADVIMEKLLIKRERLAATAVETTSNYPADLTATLSAGDTWLDAGGDPEEDAVTAANAIKARCGRVPNAVQMSGNSLRLLRTSPAFRERIKYTNAGPVSDEAIKAFLGVKFLVVGDAMYDSAVPGATEARGAIWADGALFFVYEPSATQKSVSFGKMVIRNHLYAYEYTAEDLGGVDGRVKKLEMGWEYKLAPGFVVSSSDADFAAGYYLDNIV